MNRSQTPPATSSGVSTSKKLGTAPRRMKLGSQANSIAEISGVGCWFNAMMNIFVIASIAVAEVIRNSTSASKTPIRFQMAEGALELTSQPVPTTFDEIAALVETQDDTGEEVSAVVCVGNRPSFPGTFLRVNDGDLVVVSEHVTRESSVNAFGILSETPGIYVWLSNDQYIPTEPAALDSFRRRHYARAQEIAAKTGNEFVLNLPS